MQTVHKSKLDSKRIEWNDKEQEATWSTDTETHSYSYAHLEWECSFLKHEPGPLTEVLREYQQRKLRGELR